MDLIALFSDPAAWAALLTLVVLEIVLGVDNLVFIAILSNKLPKSQQTRARRIGLMLALIMRIALLMLIGWLVTLQTPLFDLGLQGASGPHGEPTFETAFSGRDLILLVGGLFLLWKATKEIHHNIDPEAESGELLDPDKGVAEIAFTSAIAQIIALDLVFSIDSILTAVGMTDDIPIMVAAVIITVTLMLFAADPLATSTLRWHSPWGSSCSTWRAARGASDRLPHTLRKSNNERFSPPFRRGARQPANQGGGDRRRQSPGRHAGDQQSAGRRIGGPNPGA